MYWNRKLFQQRFLAGALLFNWYTFADFNRNLEKKMAEVKNYDGKQVKVAGYMTGYEPIGGKAETREFLFVPLLAYCIHVQPAPPEMTLQVKMKKNTPIYDGQFIWLQGTLKLVPESVGSTKKVFEVEGDSVTLVKDSELAEARQGLPLQDPPDCAGRDKYEGVCAGQNK